MKICPQCGEKLNDAEEYLDECMTCAAISLIEYPSGIEAEVCKDIAERQKFGHKKYGTTVSDNPLTLREWLEHAYFERLDCAIYLKRAIGEIDKTK